MSIPSEVGMTIMRYATSPEEYISIQRQFRIPDQEIEQAIVDECTKDLQGLSPVEQLYHIRHPEPRYILMLETDSMPWISTIGTKEDIMKKIESHALAAEGTILEMENISLDEQMEYYQEKWNPYPVGSTPDEMEIVPWFEEAYLDHSVEEGRFGYYVIGPI